MDDIVEGSVEDAATSSRCGGIAPRFGLLIPQRDQSLVTEDIPNVFYSFFTRKNHFILIMLDTSNQQQYSFLAQSMPRL
jgi:hypothetical protein